MNLLSKSAYYHYIILYYIIFLFWQTLLLSQPPVNSTLRISLCETIRVKALSLATWFLWPHTQGLILIRTGRVLGPIDSFRTAFQVDPGTAHSSLSVPKIPSSLTY